MAGNQPRLAVLVLNYNGRELLARCLPSVINAAAKVPGGCRVVVVDNRSTDESVSFVRSTFPEVEVFVTPLNDYLFSLNAVVAAYSEEFIVILNNDMIVAEQCFVKLLPWMEQPGTFAVTCRLYNWTGDRFSEEPAPLNTLLCKDGWCFDSYSSASATPCLAQIASGGASLYRRSMYLSLGGFDRLFRPGYFEDTDLSIRAWQRGWQIVFEPRSEAYHFHSVSMRRAYGDRILHICERNRVLLMAKTLGDSRWLMRFLCLYPKRVLQHLAVGNRGLARAMLAALPRLPRALASRSRERRHHCCRRSPAEIEALMGSPA